MKSFVVVAVGVMVVVVVAGFKHVQVALKASESLFLHQELFFSRSFSGLERFSSAHPPARPPICLPACLSVFLSACLSDYLSSRLIETPSKRLYRFLSAGVEQKKRKEKNRRQLVDGFPLF